MSFKKLPDNRGLIYVPEWPVCEKKHPCRDCFSCQWCSNERCRVCRGMGPGVREKTALPDKRHKE